VCRIPHVSPRTDALSALAIMVPTRGGRKRSHRNVAVTATISLPDALRVALDATILRESGRR